MSSSVTYDNDLAVAELLFSAAALQAPGFSISWGDRARLGEFLGREGQLAALLRHHTMFAPRPSRPTPSRPALPQVAPSPEPPPALAPPPTPALRARAHPAKRERSASPPPSGSSSAPPQKRARRAPPLPAGRLDKGKGRAAASSDASVAHEEQAPAPLHEPAPSTTHQRAANIDDDVPFVCGWRGCAELVSSRKAPWTKHLSSAHGVDQTSWAQLQAGKGQRCRRTGCPSERTYATLANLTRHYRIKHQRLCGFACPRPSCPRKGKLYDHPSSYQRHLRTVCGQGAADKENAEPVAAGPSGHRHDSPPPSECESDAERAVSDIDDDIDNLKDDLEYLDDAEE